MKTFFTKHPNSIGETYFQHLRFALAFGANMLLGGLACIVHAIFPFLFEKTGSNMLLKMFHQFVERMPVPEERVIMVSQTIERKKKAANH